MYYWILKPRGEDGELEVHNKKWYINSIQIADDFLKNLDNQKSK